MATHAARKAAARALRPADSGAPILASKITAPGVPDWAVPRPRIIKLIARGTRRCPLTVVTGPAGAGKTMALALWAAAGPGTVAWVSLDEFDNRPGVFWAHLVATLRRSGVAVPGALPAAAPGRDAGDVFVLRLAAELAAQDPSATLVLDDLHLLTDPQVLDGLGYVLRMRGLGCAWWSAPGWTRCCRCTATGSPASWPRSGPTTLPSPSPKPACWPSTTSRCRRTRWSTSPGGQRPVNGMARVSQAGDHPWWMRQAGGRWGDTDRGGQVMVHPGRRWHGVSGTEVPRKQHRYECCHAGEGPGVLLVHGFPDMHKVGRQVIPALVSAGYRVIAPDTRGCGETETHVAAASRSGRR